MDNGSVKFEVGQSFGTFEELKAKLESMATSKRENINTKFRKTEEWTSYLDANGEEIGYVFQGTISESRKGAPLTKKDIKNDGIIKIGNVAYFIPEIRDGKGGRVYKITLNGARVAVDEDHDGFIGEDELIIRGNNEANNK